ncbi:hypothetical protein GCM10007198_19790 [Microbacterium aerolatum]|uniref:Uncharacterized protein n=2 Tax=Microbacterium aerolatum TaxID=153731 RepID=A0A511AGI9_9MICO|nr:hypothetical protein MAE01_03030 [Microbacterium aerolatum]GGB29387.1 hypothetical protein GCM10007198_19790 [Microbacterium aerolatum]
MWPFFFAHMLTSNHIGPRGFSRKDAASKWMPRFGLTISETGVFMPEMTRRTVLTLGAALGFAGVVAPTAAWSWSPSRSMLGTGDGTDPSWVWDDDLDRIMANVVTSGQVPP